MRLSISVVILLLLAACATPVQVERVDPRVVHRELTTNVISTGDLSEPTQIALHREDLDEYFDTHPEQVIANLHRTATAGRPDPDLLFALSELSFRHAEDTGKPAYYLASAVYAFAFLFPDDPGQRRSPFDPRVRTAGDLYNRSLTSAFASGDRSRVLLQSGRFELPFGTLDITFDPKTARWGDLALTEFTPADELHIQGLQNRYRQRGIGAPLAASATASGNEKGLALAPGLKVPVTALLRVDSSRQRLAQGNLRGSIEVYPAFEPESVTIRGQPVPLELDSTAAFAYGLSDPKIWQSEFAGFLQGEYFGDDHPLLAGIEPYRPGQIPVIFIHGTASSSGRWANLVNDLQSDPLIREHFQFWRFTYATGNPMPYSAFQLRKAIEEAVHQLDPQNRDPALRQIVLMGHSQGGLLAKMLVIESGPRLWNAFSSRPLEELQVSPETRDLLRQAMFVTPVSEVKRVIFLATPQHGSFVAGSIIGQLIGRLVTLPGNVVTALGETLSGNPAALLSVPGAGGFGSVWSMTPENPALVAFAAIPVSPKVATHSIIAVQGDGPVETGDDGVVAYQSAHIPETESELVVRSGHSMQDNPHTVAEVRRILLLHLAQNCPQGCTPATAMNRPISTIDTTSKMQRLSQMAGRQRQGMAAADHLGGRLRVRPIFGRVAGWICYTLLAIVILSTAVWCSIAIWYRYPAGDATRGTLGAAILAVAVVTAAFVTTRKRWLALAVYLGFFALFVGWWTTIKPMNERNWAPEVARTATATIDGDRLVVRNVRNFAWRSDTDFDQRWEERTYNPSHVTNVDLVMSYWAGEAIAHTIVSFGFDDAPRLAFSIETRKESHEGYSSIAGFFKQYELAMVAADERDVVRVRSNVRGEDVRIYRLRMTPANTQLLLREYVQEINELAREPRFYNTLTANCTNLVFDMVRVIHPGLPLDIRVLLSGYLPNYAYDLGATDTSVSFERLRELAKIHEKAMQADTDPLFSTRIREGIPAPR